MNYSQYEGLSIEKEGKITVVKINRPEGRNSINYELHASLARVFGDLACDEDTWVVVLTGAGKNFAAGADINWFKRHIENPEANPMAPMGDAIKILQGIIDLPRPVIAAVNGAAIGLGASLALACDIIIAAEDARIADPHVNMGLAAGDGGCVLWPLLMGLAKAKEYLFTGAPLDIKEAERLGIINRVVPPDQLMSEAMAFANRLINDVSPLAVKNTKMAINKLVRERLNLILPTSVILEYALFSSNDHKEAVNAFLEKRRPNFNGT